MEWGSIPQWITAGIAIAAGVIAILNIVSQRAIARRRAAFDIFLKTETDEKMITAYDSFHSGISSMRKAASVVDFCTADSFRSDYFQIRKYLNVHELIAVGIKEDVLDDDVCYAYWGDTLLNNYNDAKPIIDFLASRQKNKYTYSDLKDLCLKWSARKAAAVAPE